MSVPIMFHLCVGGKPWPHSGRADHSVDVEFGAVVDAPKVRHLSFSSFMNAPCPEANYTIAGKGSISLAACYFELENVRCRTTCERRV